MDGRNNNNLLAIEFLLYFVKQVQFIFPFTHKPSYSSKIISRKIFRNFATLKFLKYMNEICLRIITDLTDAQRTSNEVNCRYTFIKTVYIFPKTFDVARIIVLSIIPQTLHFITFKIHLIKCSEIHSHCMWLCNNAH